MARFICRTLEKLTQIPNVSTRYDATWEPDLTDFKHIVPSSKNCTYVNCPCQIPILVIFGSPLICLNWCITKIGCLKQTTINTVSFKKLPFVIAHFSKLILINNLFWCLVFSVLDVLLHITFSHSSLYFKPIQAICHVKHVLDLHSIYIFAWF